MLTPPLHGNGKFIGISENIFKCLLVLISVLEDDFNGVVFVDQDAVYQRHQDTTVQLFDVLILLEERDPVPLRGAGSHRLLHFFSDPKKRLLLVLNDFGVAVSELKVFCFVDYSVREVFIETQLELLVTLNFLFELGNLRLVVEYLPVLGRKALNQSQSVFQIDDKLNLIMNGAEHLFLNLFGADAVGLQVRLRLLAEQT